MSNQVAADGYSATSWSIVLSVLMIATGVLAIALPQVAGIAVTTVVAWLLMFSGALHLVFAWRAGRARVVIWEILVGVAYGVIGFYVLAQPIAGLASLTLMLAIYLFVEGMLEFVLAFELRSLPGTGWLLFDGVVTLVLAVMIWSTWPSSSLWVLGTLVGVSMFFSGITRLMLSMAVRRLAA
jgi:uncharacterized membrane protein HdeD (DUF308 family)